MNDNDLDLKTLSYRLYQLENESQSYIQNVFFTSNSNLLQILAIDFIKQLLILATWDIDHDYETSMMQIDKTEEEDDMADLSVMRGIGINNKKGK